VAALITRQVGDLTELCVFDHAGNVQLPAGTMDPGEVPVESAAREAWEETGLPHLELVGEVAVLDELTRNPGWPDVALMVTPHEGCPVTRGHAVQVLERTGTSVTIANDYFGWRGEVPATCVERDVSRHVFHLRTTTPTPNEWWVLTPDGGGSQWRCRWIPLDDRSQVHPSQQAWIDVAREAIAPGPPVPASEPLPAGADEVYDAYNEVRLVMRAVDGAPPGEAPRGSSYAVCVTADGDTVLVNEDGRPAWGLPGGRPEPGESAEETLTREVLEEACARVVEHELLLTSCDSFLDTERRVTARCETPIYWARVELDAWAPQFEKTARHLVPIADLATVLRWEVPLYLAIQERALAAESRRAR